MASGSASVPVNESGSQVGAPPPWTNDVVWQSHVAALQRFPDGFSVLELCAGAGTASIALQLLLGQERSRLAGAWDICKHLQPIYEQVHGLSAPAHLGQFDGDVLATDLAAFPCANAVVCGPPCPPFSVIGKRLALADERSRPFQRCIDIIVDLSRRTTEKSASPPLMFFMVENVMGINHRGQQNASPLDSLIHNLQRQLGDGWAIQQSMVNALDFGLPQSRKRIYVVGRNMRWYPRGQPVPPPFFDKRVLASQILDTSDTTPRLYTRLQTLCLNAWKSKYRSFMENREMRGKYAFVEVNRDPTDRTSWRGNSVHVDRCECLRASGPMLHVFALGEGVGQLPLDRPLRMRERAALQGFPDSVGHLRFDEVAGKRILGNAMAVPVIGSLLAQELRFLLGAWPSSVLVAACSGGQVVAQSSASALPSSAQCFSPQQQLGHPQPSNAAQQQQQHLSYTNTMETDGSADDCGLVLPGLRSACVAWAANIRAHWNSGQPGRAPKPPTVLGQFDEIVLQRRSAKRQRLSMWRLEASDEDIGARGLAGQTQASFDARSSRAPESSLGNQDSTDSDAPMTHCNTAQASRKIAATPQRSPAASPERPPQQRTPDALASDSESDAPMTRIF